MSSDYKCRFYLTFLLVSCLHSKSLSQTVTYTLANGAAFNPSQTSGFVEFYPSSLINNVANIDLTKIIYYNTIYFNNLGTYIPKSTPISSSSNFLQRPFVEFPSTSYANTTIFYYHKLFDYQKNTIFQYRQNQVPNWAQMIYKPLLMNSPTGTPFNYPIIQVFYTVSPSTLSQPLNLPFHLWVRPYQPDYTWNYPILSPSTTVQTSTTSSVPIIYVPYSTASILPTNVIYFSTIYYNYDYTKLSNFSGLNLADKNFIHINDAIYKPYQLRTNHILYEMVFFWPNQTEIQDFSKTFIPNKEQAVYKPLVLLYSPTITSTALNYKNSFFTSSPYVTNGFQYSDPLQLLAQPYLNNVFPPATTTTSTTTTKPTTTTTIPTSTTTTPTTTTIKPITTTTTPMTTTTIPTTTTTKPITTTTTTTTPMTTTTIPTTTTTSPTTTTTKPITTTTTPMTTTTKPTTTTTTPTTTTSKPTTTTTKPTTTTAKPTTTTTKPTTTTTKPTSTTTKATTTTTRTRKPTKTTTTKKPRKIMFHVLIPAVIPINRRAINPSITQINQPITLDQTESDYYEAFRNFWETRFNFI